MTLTVRLPDDCAKHLEYLSKRSGVPKSKIALTGLKYSMEYFDWLDGLQQIMEDVRSGKEETYTIAEVREHLGL